MPLGTTSPIGPRMPNPSSNRTNTSGQRVASGVYVYQIKNNYSEKRGKLIIVR